MAVYKRSYRGYAGSVTSEWSRFAIIPRYAYRGLFRSKIMTAFFVICFIPPLVFLFLIYLANNIGSFARVFGVTGATSPFAVDGEFFATYLGIQAALSFVLTAFVGPGLISGDLANRALPLYLRREARQRHHDLVHGAIESALAVLEIEEDADAGISDPL